MDFGRPQKLVGFLVLGFRLKLSVSDQVNHKLQERPKSLDPLVERRPQIDRLRSNLSSRGRRVFWGGSRVGGLAGLQRLCGLTPSIWLRLFFVFSSWFLEGVYHYCTYLFARGVKLRGNPKLLWLSCAEEEKLRSWRIDLLGR